MFAQNRKKDYHEIPPQCCEHYHILSAGQILGKTVTGISCLPCKISLLFWFCHHVFSPLCVEIGNKSVFTTHSHPKIITFSGPLSLLSH